MPGLRAAPAGGRRGVCGRRLPGGGGGGVGTGQGNPGSPGNAAQTEMVHGGPQVCELLALI